MRELKSLNGKAAQKKAVMNFTFRLNYDRGKVSFAREVIKDFSGKFNTVIEDKGILYLIALPQSLFNQTGKSIPCFIPKPSGETVRLKTADRSVFLQWFRELFPQVKNTPITEFATAELRASNAEQADSVRNLLENSYGELTSEMEVYQIVPGKNVKRSASYGKRPEGALAAAHGSKNVEKEEETPDTLQEQPLAENNSQEKEVVNF